MPDLDLDALAKGIATHIGAWFASTTPPFPHELTAYVRARLGEAVAELTDKLDFIRDQYGWW